jgi:hypothetical protein
MDCKRVIWPTHAFAVLMLFTGIVILLCSAQGIFRIGAPTAQAAPPQKGLQQRPALPAGPGSGTAAVDIPTLQKLAADVDLKFNDLKAQLDYNAKNAENLGKLLAALTLFTSLFAIALGANSYFGFRQILQSAKDDLNLAHREVEDIPKKMDAMQAEIYAAYPLLRNVNAAVRELVATLRVDVLPVDANWRLDLHLTEANVEHALTAELRVAVLEIFQLGRFERYRRPASEIYQALALFYGYRAARKADAAGTPGDPFEGPEIQRALLYIEKACQTDEKNAAAFRDFGALLAARQDFTAAKRKYEESLGIDREEPGALFGLAYIQATVTNPPDLMGAIERMNALLQKSHWEPGQKKKYLAEAYTNRACYQTLLGKTSAPAEQDALYSKAIGDLEEGRKAAEEHKVLTEWQGRVTTERTTGDLVDLNARFKARIDVLIQ